MHFFQKQHFQVSIDPTCLLNFEAHRTRVAQNIKLNRIKLDLRLKQRAPQTLKL